MIARHLISIQEPGLSLNAVELLPWMIMTLALLPITMDGHDLRIDHCSTCTTILLFKSRVLNCALGKPGFIRNRWSQFKTKKKL